MSVSAMAFVQHSPRQSVIHIVSRYSQCRQPSSVDTADQPLVETPLIVQIQRKVGLRTDSRRDGQTRTVLLSGSSHPCLL